MLKSIGKLHVKIFVFMLMWFNKPLNNPHIFRKRIDVIWLYYPRCTLYGKDTLYKVIYFPYIHFLYGNNQNQTDFSKILGSFMRRTWLPCEPLTSANCRSNASSSLRLLELNPGLIDMSSSFLPWPPYNMLQFQGAPVDTMLHWLAPSDAILNRFGVLDC